MNTFLISLTLIAVLYIVVSAFKYAFTLVFTSSLIIAGASLANHYAGQSAMLLVLIISPVLYVAVSDLVGTLKSVKMHSVQFMDTEKQHTATELVEAVPLKGEWISGKTPLVTFQQLLIGDVKALPKPWL